MYLIKCYGVRRIRIAGTASFLKAGNSSSNTRIIKNNFALGTNENMFTVGLQRYRTEESPDFVPRGVNLLIREPTEPNLALELIYQTEHKSRN